MVFLPIILFILGGAFIIAGYRQEDQMKISMGIVMILAAAGTTVITLFAFSALR
jgi:hypothetical protein